jgi:hypothetical protein
MQSVEAKVSRRTMLAGLAAAPWAGAVMAREVTRDVPYVPTPQPVVDAMLKLGEAKAGDYHIDLGCGDGRIVVTAARDFGTRGLGVDIDPRRIAEARFLAERERVQDRVEFRRGDLFQTDISRATLLTLYLLPAVNMRLRPTILARLKPGTRVVSHDFDMGDWPPDRTERLKEEGSTVYFWTVPANVAGLWRVTAANGGAHEVRIDQRFQRLTGEAFRDGRVEGAGVRFTFADGRTYMGRADGETIAGDGWRAVRVGD